MLVRVENNKSQAIPITEHDARVMRRVREAMKKRMKGFRRTKAFKTGRWDGYIRFVDKAGRFGTGMLPYILKLFAQHRVKELDVQDKRVNGLDFGEIGHSYFGVKLYDWQKEAAVKFSTGTLAGMPWKRGIVNAATNAGKSLLFSVLQKEKRSNGRTVVLIDDREVFTQLREGFEENGIQAGFLHQKQFGDADVIVMMYRSALNRIKDTPEVREAVKRTDLLISDECHTAGSKLYRRLIAQFENAEGRMFVSGTPLEQADSLKAWHVIEQSGHQIKRVSNREMIEKGVSMKPKVYLKRVGGAVMENEWEDDYRSNVIYNIERADTIRRICEREGRNTLIAVYRVEHGRFLEEVIPGSYFLEGSDPNRDEIYQRFKAGEIPTLITTILKKGVNIPIMNTLVLAMGRKSRVDIKQWIGRLLRRNEKDEEVEVYDFMDSGKYVRKHSMSRKRIYEKEGFEIEIQT